jgi:hypothetical protein
LLLAASGAIAAAIGAAILIAPAGFLAGYNIRLTPDASLFSELRAAGGVVLGMGALMIVGVFVAGFARTGLTIATALYLSYGLSRVLGVATDGWPDQGLVVAGALELSIGAACLIALIRSGSFNRE